MNGYQNKHKIETNNDLENSGDNNEDGNYSESYEEGSIIITLQKVYMNKIEV